jgi:hypothetical protein
MNRKIMLSTSITFVVLVVILGVYLLDVGGVECTGDDIDQLTLENENEIVDLSRDNCDKTGKINFTYVANESIDSEFQSSLTYRDWVISGCSYFQKFYLDEKFKKDIYDYALRENLDMPEIELKIDDFLKDYKVIGVNVKYFKEDGSKLYTCTINGVNPDQNIIELYGSEGTRYTNTLDKFIWFG